MFAIQILTIVLFMSCPVHTVAEVDDDVEVSIRTLLAGDGSSKFSAKKKKKKIQDLFLTGFMS